MAKKAFDKFINGRSNAAKKEDIRKAKRSAKKEIAEGIIRTKQLKRAAKAEAKEVRKAGGVPTKGGYKGTHQTDESAPAGRPKPRPSAPPSEGRKTAGYKPTKGRKPAEGRKPTEGRKPSDNRKPAAGSRKAYDRKQPDERKPREDRAQPEDRKTHEDRAQPRNPSEARQPLEARQPAEARKFFAPGKPRAGEPPAKVVPHTVAALHPTEDQSTEVPRPIEARKVTGRRRPVEARRPPEARDTAQTPPPADTRKPAETRKPADTPKTAEGRPAPGAERRAPADTRRAPAKPAGPQMPLNKYIAHGGISSRREAADIVKSGVVKVNGKVVTDPGFKIFDKDEVKVNGKKVVPTGNLVYILLNKPKDFITTSNDPEGRKTVLDLVRKATDERIFPIGRLDRNTTGVLLLTNDGELTQKLAHPAYEVKKVYEVRLDKDLTKKDFDQIISGVTLEDGLISPDALAYADAHDKSIVGIEIHSGKNRIVRRIFEHLGYTVKNLDRVMYAGLTKKNVDRGRWRFLSEKEVRLLKYLNTSFTRKK